MQISTLLQNAIALGITSLEATVLLAQVLNVSRASIYAWPDKTVSEKDSEQFQSLVLRRLKGEPHAYLLGKKEFWSLPLSITSDVLIPRPETELLVELALERLDKQASLRILELGTGSGAIALALASECPHWNIVATDLSSQALTVAKKNASDLSISNIDFYRGDWFQAISQNKKIEPPHFHAVISNPPYISACDPHLKQIELSYEPLMALKSEDSGFRDLKKIIREAPTFLLSKGWLLLEHGYEQAEEISLFLKGSGYHCVETIQDLAGVNRVTLGQKP